LILAAEFVGIISPLAKSPPYEKAIDTKTTGLMEL
jgi:hypothetical protein